jgi:hypothetical protein
MSAPHTTGVAALAADGAGTDTPPRITGFSATGVVSGAAP